MKMNLCELSKETAVPLDKYAFEHSLVSRGIERNKDQHLSRQIEFEPFDQRLS